MKKKRIINIPHDYAKKEEKVLRQLGSQHQKEMQQAKKIFHKMSQENEYNQIVHYQIKTILVTSELPEAKLEKLMELKNEIDKFHLDERLDQFLQEKINYYKNKIKNIFSKSILDNP